MSKPSKPTGAPEHTSRLLRKGHPKRSCPVNYKVERIGNRKRAHTPKNSGTPKDAAARKGPKTRDVTNGDEIVQINSPFGVGYKGINKQRSDTKGHRLYVFATSKYSWRGIRGGT